jgi:phage tail-like protein
MGATNNQMGQTGRRTYAGGNFTLELDGLDAGLLTSAEGGGFKSEPIGEQVGGENLVTRYPGRQRFEEITVQVGGAMSPDFWKWVSDSIAGKPSRKNGAIVSRDYDSNERSRRTFYDALIAEIQFPELDAKSKGPKILTVKIAPERIAFDERGGPKPSSGPGGAMRTQKRTTPINFRLRLDGLEEQAAKRVSKIEAFSVKQQIIANPMGGLLYERKEPGRIEFPTLSLHLPELDAGPWMKWWEQFVGKGEHVQKNERTGSIAYLNSDLTQTIINVDLYGVGITGVTFAKMEAAGDVVRTVKVDLYVESLRVEAGKR